MPPRDPSPGRRRGTWSGLRGVVLAAVVAIALPVGAGAAAADPQLPGIPVPGVPTPGPLPGPTDGAGAGATPGGVAPGDGAGTTGGATPDGGAGTPGLGAVVPTVVPTPEPPRTPEEARQRLGDVQREAEALTEQWHAATDDLTAKQEDADRLREAVDPLRTEADHARADEETYRQSLQDVTLAFYDDGRLDQFSALLTSSDPQDYLDQMSALETLSGDRLVALQELHGKVERAAQTQADADDATTRAQTAADDAKRAADEIQVRKADADRRIDEAESLLRALSPREREDFNGPAEDAPDVDWGTGVGAEALRAAATKLGKPYVWGASGPNRFDCSGLTSWAFKQAGITLPRSSSAQSKVGRAVSWDELQPGDLVFYYNPVSHVGIYAGGGKMINAPQSGDVVKYQTVNRKVFSGARRL